MQYVHKKEPRHGICCCCRGRVVAAATSIVFIVCNAKIIGARFTRCRAHGRTNTIHLKLEFYTLQTHVLLYIDVMSM